MKIINKKTGYALKILILLAKADRKMTSRQISEAGNLPLIFMRRICQDLVRNKLIESKEGAKGGFRLLKSTKEISIFQVMHAVNTNNICICSYCEKDCSIKNKLSYIEDKILKELIKVKVFNLL